MTVLYCTVPGIAAITHFYMQRSFANALLGDGHLWRTKVCGDARKDPTRNLWLSAENTRRSQLLMGLDLRSTQSVSFISSLK